jgi:hypothetical protein
MIHVRHAAAAIASGLCETVLITHGESGRTHPQCHNTHEPRRSVRAALWADGAADFVHDPGRALHEDLWPDARAIGDGPCTRRSMRQPRRSGGGRGLSGCGQGYQIGTALAHGEDRNRVGKAAQWAGPERHQRDRVGQLVVSNFVEPLVYGGQTGLSSVALIAAATFWTWLWGPIGLLLSTPVTVCLVVLGRHVPQLQFLDVMLGNEPVLTPMETFYQRILANDPEEATEQAEEFAKDRPLVEFFDEVAIPALARAQADSDRGVMAPEARATFKAGIEAMIQNLSEDEDAASAREDAAHPKPERTLGVLCVAGRNDLDEAAALLLVQALRLERRMDIGPPLSADVLSADTAYLPLFKDGSVVCLSLISTSSPARARFLVRRIRRRAPRARVLVGFWGSPAREPAAAEMTLAASAQGVAFSLRDAVAHIDAMLTTEKASARVI